jgi:hypothetical protein
MLAGRQRDLAEVLDQFRDLLQVESEVRMGFRGVRGETAQGIGAENSRLKWMYQHLSLENAVQKDVTRKNCRTH